MRSLALALLALMAGVLHADAPTYGKLRVSDDTVNIYEGASANSKLAGTAQQDDEFDLRGDKTYGGFYKIQYGKKVCFVMASQVQLLGDLPTALPTEAPTVQASQSLSPVVMGHDKGNGKDDGDDEGEDDHEATPLPTVKATLRPTLRPTEAPTEEEEEEPTATAVPTRRPTLKPTEVPTQVPSEEATEAPSALPTAIPTRRATLRPTDLPTAVPTQRPTAVPTATSIPTSRPTPAPTAAISVGHGRRRKEAEREPVYETEHRERHSGGSGVILWSGSNSMLNILPPRDPQKLADLWLYMPLGVGKHQGSIRPAFKPDDTVADVRYIESSAFLGLGIEARLPAPWLRLSGDWTYFTHRTKAAEQNKLATKVGLPAPAQASFPDSDVYYQVNTHAFRLGLKASLPSTHVEPWVNGTVGAYAWSAEYLDGARQLTYGGDMGLAFGATVGTGIDFHFPQAHSVFTVTPFVEWGAPIVHPTIDDVGGIGQTWKDDYGTLLAPESRWGIQLAIGY